MMLGGLLERSRITEWGFVLPSTADASSPSFRDIKGPDTKASTILHSCPHRTLAVCERPHSPSLRPSPSHWKEPVWHRDQPQEGNDFGNSALLSGAQPQAQGGPCPRTPVPAVPALALPPTPPAKAQHGPDGGEAH